jgi:hypothetical protein
MTFQDLTNEEILFMYHEMNEELARYQTIIETKKVTESVSILDYGAITVDYLLQDSEVKELINDKHYLFVVGLHRKLELIASIIQEAEPELASKVEISYQKRF